MAASASSKTQNADQIVRVLLKSGANVTAMGDDGFNLMNWAIKNGNHTIIVELVKYGIVEATTETNICHYGWCEDLITWATKRKLTGKFFEKHFFCNQYLLFCQAWLENGSLTAGHYRHPYNPHLPKD